MKSVSAMLAALALVMFAMAALQRMPALNIAGFFFLIAAVIIKKKY